MACWGYAFMTEKLLAVRMPACRSFVGHKSMGVVAGVADGGFVFWMGEK